MSFNVIKWKRWESDPILLEKEVSLDVAQQCLEDWAKEPEYDYIIVPSTYWARYADLREMDEELMEMAITKAGYYCADAVNLSFRLSSSTSGMYCKWYIEVALDCTVYLDRRAPIGYGSHINHALRRFIASCVENSEGLTTTQGQVIGFGDPE